MDINRRSFLKAAAAMGASLAWVGQARGSRVGWHERRDLYPHGVASGDPDPHSVILWTRRPFAEGTRQLLTAINSLKGYRTLRYGRCLDLIITDQHSYRNADPFSDPSLEKLGGDEYIGMFPESGMRILDGGRAYGGGKPPADIGFNDAHVPNPQRNAPPQTILGAAQKAWFK